jgi:hypothetical protein
MRKFFSALSLLASLFHIARSAPLVENSNALTSRQSSENPCSALAQINPYNGFVPSDFKACMDDVPFYPEDAANLVNYLLLAINFQTTLSYLKAPPPGYAWPATDIVGGLQTILNNVNTKGYTSHYDLEADIMTLLFTAHDGHLSFQAGLAGSVGIYRIPLVSVSDDGIAQPKVYAACKSLLSLLGHIFIVLSWICVPTFFQILIAFR